MFRIRTRDARSDVHSNARRARRTWGRLVAGLLAGSLVGPIPLLPAPAAAAHNMKPIIWVANSSEGTISLLDTVSGTERGRYRTGPASTFTSPSRTTVDIDGAAWVANRNTGTAVKYHHPDNCPPGPTSSGSVPLPYGDDACFAFEVFAGPGARGIAVDRNNDVWIGTYAAPPNVIKKFRGSDGALLDTMSIPSGAYGALIDGSGYLWIAHNNGFVSRIDVRTGSATYGDRLTFRTPGQAYGIGCDPFGHIWVTDLGPDSNGDGWVHKIDAATATALGSFNHGQGYAQGVTGDANGDIWVAGSLVGSTVSRLDNSGNLLATIPVGSGPTGVAVDNVGKVWATNINSNNASRIDPATNTVDGTFPVGSGPYNYSDMTGFVLHHCTLDAEDDLPVVAECLAIGLAVRLSSTRNNIPPLNLELSRSATSAVASSGFSTGQSDTAVARAEIPPHLGAGVIESRCRAEARSPGGGYAEGEAQSTRFEVDLRPEGVPLHIRGEILREAGATPPGVNDANIAELWVNGTPVVSGSYAPITAIALPAGVEVIINEQQVAPHPSNPSCSVASGNALRVGLDTPLLASSVSGGIQAEVIVSHVATSVC